MKKLRTAWGVFLAIVCGAVAARGEIVTVEFDSVVGSVTDSAGLLGSHVSPGMPVRGSIRYNTAAPDLLPDDSTEGEYVTPGWLRFEVAGLVFERSSSIYVLTGYQPHGSTRFDVRGLGDEGAWPTSLEADSYSELFFMFFQGTPQAPMFVGDSLPIAPDFSQAGLTAGWISYGSPANGTGYLILLNMTPVPEPGTWALLGLGLAALGWRARRG